jgi:hypothetical protein
LEARRFRNAEVLTLERVTMTWLGIVALLCVLAIAAEFWVAGGFAAPKTRRIALEKSPPTNGRRALVLALPLGR